MGTQLYGTAAAAYAAAAERIDAMGRAAVIQPTGTDKGDLAWKLLEDHSDDVIFWLVPGPLRLRLRQYEAEGRMLPKAHLYSCQELMMLTQEQWVALAELRPVYLILDSYHEIGPECWNNSVARLLSLCPKVKMLGLTEADSPEQPCRSAEDLFQGAVVFRRSMTEAMAEKALPVPQPCLPLFWSSQSVLAELRARVKNLRIPGRPDPNEQLYNDLSCAVQQAETAALQSMNALANRDGRYLVLYENEDWMEHCLPQLERRASREGHPARIYSVGEDALPGSAALNEFRADEKPGVRLLVYRNAPDAQLRIPELDGVILLRESSDERVFRQMLCRALASGGKNIPVIDFINSFESLANILDLRREYETVVDRMGGKPAEFSLRDPLRQSNQLFRKLRRGLEASWEQYYAAAKTCAATQKGLELPRSYQTEDGLPLGRWLEIQRQIRAGRRAGRLTEEQIARLDKLGIVWRKRLVLAWEKGCAAARKYRDEHGDLMVPVRYKDKDGFALGEWIVYNRQRYLTGNLSADRVERLQALGMVWDTVSNLWEQNYAAAARYYLEHGNLEVPIKYVTPDGVPLGIWLGSQRAAHKNGELTPEQIQRLEVIGVEWANRNDLKWQLSYEAAKRYYEEHGDLDVPAEYVDKSGILLGKWVFRQRYAFQNPKRSSARLTPERIEQLNQIGMIWSRGDPWMQRYELVRKYKEEHHGMLMTSQYRSEDGVWLGSWLARQRQRLRQSDSSLTADQRKALKLLFKEEFSRSGESVRQRRHSQRDKNWQRNYRRACVYARRQGDLLVPATYVDETGLRLGVWISNLRAARKNRPDSFQVTPEHIRLLDEIGMQWDAREAKWLSAVRRAEHYRDENGNLLVPVNYKTADGFCLGDWVRRMRECYAAADPKLTPERIGQLEQLGMVWNPTA